MDKTAKKGLEDICNKAEFLTIWQEVNCRYVAWEEFCTLPMPEGYSPDEVWLIAAIMRRHAGYNLPFVPYLSNVSGNTVWFSLPKNSQAALRSISAYASSHSYLNKEIAKRNYRHFQMWLIYPEVLSACRRDGIMLDDAEARTIWRDNKSPKTIEGEVFLTFCTTISNIEAYSHRAITRGLIEELNEKLMTMVSKEALLFKPRKRLFQTINQDVFSSDYTFGVICKLLGEKDPYRYAHPVIAWIESTSMFWDHSPLPALNALTELLIRRIFFGKTGYPALAYIPYSYASEKWEDGETENPIRLFKFEESAEKDCGQGLDSTSFHSSVLDLLKHHLNSLKKRIEEFLEREMAARNRIEDNPCLNLRQKEVLYSLIENLGLSFSIEAHQKKYGIAYSTARNDLLELSDAGYLDCKKCAHSFMFIAGVYMLRILARRSEPPRVL